MLSLDINYAKPFANLVMALGSFRDARSVTELCQSPIYHYQYSSICDAINGLCKDKTEHRKVSELLQLFVLSYLPTADKVYRLNGDTTPIKKPHSPTLAEKGYIHVPNTVIESNKPLSIGYRLSTLTLSGLQNWQLPLSMERVENDETPTLRLLKQLSGILNSDSKPFKKADLNIIRLDRAYSNAQFLSPSYHHDNLVSVSRFRAGQKIWFEKPRNQTGGRNAIYDKEPYYLIEKSRWKDFKRKQEVYQKYQRSLFELTADQTSTLFQTTLKGKQLRIEAFLWENVLIRTKNGNKMSDKKLNIVATKTYNATTNELVFQEELFMGIGGKLKDTLSIDEAIYQYQERYAIERNAARPFFRFNKQNLFLEDFQTPDLQHLDNWFLIGQTTIWLLYLTAQEAQKITPKWQQYLPKEKIENPVILSLAQAYKSAQNLFITFDKSPFLPKKYKKGRPRQKGEKQTPRTQYKVVRKAKKPPV